MTMSGPTRPQFFFIRVFGAVNALTGVNSDTLPDTSRWVPVSSWTGMTCGNPFTCPRFVPSQRHPRISRLMAYILLNIVPI